MDCRLVVSAEGIQPVIGRRLVVEPVPTDRLTPVDIVTLTEPRYVRLVSAFMQVSQSWTTAVAASSRGN